MRYNWGAKAIIQALSNVSEIIIKQFDKAIKIIFSSAWLSNSEFLPQLTSHMSAGSMYV